MKSIEKTIKTHELVGFDVLGNEKWYPRRK